MNIECNEISQVINELLIAFQDCNKLKNSDLRRFVELVSAVNVCSNGGKNYNNLISEVYEPTSDQFIKYPPSTFHSISISILRGTITQDVNGTEVAFPKGTSLNVEFTTLNQKEYSFTVKPGSSVLVEYIVESLIPDTI